MENPVDRSTSAADQVDQTRKCPRCAGLGVVPGGRVRVLLEGCCATLLFMLMMLGGLTAYALLNYVVNNRGG